MTLKRPMLIPPYTCVCDPSPIMDNPILIVHQGDFLLSIHLFRLPLSRIINYLWYVWMRTAIASRATGNVHVQLESGWLVSRVLDFVKAIRVAGSCAIVEETARRTDGRRRGRGGGRVSRDRRGGRYGSCSRTGDRATSRHTDVQ